MTKDDDEGRERLGEREFSDRDRPRGRRRSRFGEGPRNRRLGQQTAGFGADDAVDTMASVRERHQGRAWTEATETTEEESWGWWPRNRWKRRRFRARTASFSVRPGFPDLSDIGPPVT
jgi:hypothetical protein